MANSTNWRIALGISPDFPLFIHYATGARKGGRWAKKVRGVLYHFGNVKDDPKGEAALNLWLDQKDELLAGRKPRPKSDGLTVLDLSTAFLAAKQLQQEAGEITTLTWKDYRATCKWIVAYFGQSRSAADLQPDDFGGFRAELTKGRGLVALGNEIRRTRGAFKYAYDAGLLAAPVRFGPMFKQPSSKALKRLRAQQRSEGGGKDFTAAEILKLLRFATPQLKAMILLGVNCGFGNTDCGRLPLSAVDLENGWISFPRPKTGAPRRCPLWSETKKALRTVLADRRTPKDPQHAELVFVTVYCKSFAKSHGCQPISRAFKKLADDCGLGRDRRNFYSLRHVFRTIAGGAKDVEATRHIMGHDESFVEDSYIERIDDSRLLAVANHVHAWLYAKKTAKGSGREKTAAAKARTPRTSKGTC